jgi:hypothetical protein
VGQPQGLISNPNFDRDAAGGPSLDPVGVVSHRMGMTWVELPSDRAAFSAASGREPIGARRGQRREQEVHRGPGDGQH